MTNGHLLTLVDIAHPILSFIQAEGSLRASIVRVPVKVEDLLSRPRKSPWNLSAKNKLALEELHPQCQEGLG